MNHFTAKSINHVGNYDSLLDTEEVVTEMPNGWSEMLGASTAPNGYIWISNGFSIISGKCKLKLLKLKKINSIEHQRKEPIQLSLF